MVNITNVTLSLHYAAYRQRKPVDVIASRLIEHDGHRMIASVYRAWNAGVLLAEIILPRRKHALLTHANASSVLELIHHLDCAPSDSDIDTLHSLLTACAGDAHPTDIWDIIPSTKEEEEW